MEYLWGFGTFSIGDGANPAIEFETAVTRVWFELEDIVTQTLDRKYHIEEHAFRGYCETTITNVETGEGTLFAQLASLLSNNTALRIYPEYDDTQSNLLLDCHLVSDFAPEAVCRCKVGQQITLRFREYDQRTSLPTTLHYPAGETFRVLHGEDLTGGILTGEDATSVWLWGG